MNIVKKELDKGEVELTVEVSVEELKTSVERAVVRISEEVKIEGFRPGKATYEVLAPKVGELAILEEAARIYISKHLDKIITDNIDREVVGQPQINITKLAPGNPLELKVTAALMPEVTLGKYKELSIKQTKTPVKQEEIDKMLDELKEMRIKETISAEPVKDTDKVILDINVFLDKVPVEGGQAKDTAITIGKGYVVAGFDKQLIGAKKGEEREFQLHYPEDHYQKNLAGKLVDFKVKVKDVFDRELPALNDQFAEFFGMKNLEALKADVKKTLEQEKSEMETQKTDVKVLEAIVAEAKFGDIPEAVITHEGEVMMSELERNLEQQGAKLEDYLNSIKKGKQELVLEMMPDAVKRVKTALIMREIAITEKIKATDHEIGHEIEHVLSHYKDNKEAQEKIKTIEYKNYLANSLTNRKVMKKLREWNLEGYVAVAEEECGECEH